MENELKELIINALELEDIRVEDIDSHDALFNEGLGLDSIEALGNVESRYRRIRVYSVHFLF
ncbi:MAG: hypothetical protein ACU841_17285, partial [Gammaproteobacteria bacterium]